MDKQAIFQFKRHTFSSLFGLIVIATMKEQFVLLLVPRIDACIKLLIVANVKAGLERVDIVTLFIALLVHERKALHVGKEVLKNLVLHRAVATAKVVEGRNAAHDPVHDSAHHNDTE